MGKRSDFKTRKHDKYPTPEEAMRFVLPYLKPGTAFCEPCAGDGRMVGYLLNAGLRCTSAWDTHPRHKMVKRLDARTTRDLRAMIYVTNPPWTREIMHPIIDNLSAHLPSWFIFDADWMHTNQATASGLLQRCSMVVSVGRLKWIAGSKFTGLENCCWYLFEPGHTAGPRIVGRQHQT